jgi:hypothetical protein
MPIATLAQGELAGLIVGRVDPVFVAKGGSVRDPLHGKEIVLAPVPPMTQCPEDFGAAR